MLTSFQKSMRTFALALTLTFVAAPAAFAETVVYQGEANGKAVVLMLDTQLPARLTVSESGGFYDPEYQRQVPVTKSISGVVGTATLTIAGQSSTVALTADGEPAGNNASLALDARFSRAVYGGFGFYGALFLASGSVVSGVTNASLTSLQLPATFTVHFTETADGGVRYGDVRFSRQ